MAPEPPADFVQRPVEFEALKRKLLDAKGDAVAITAALRGAGGYGKTTLAKALAHDPDIAGRLFRRHPLGRAWREARKPAFHHLGPDRILSGERPGLENLNAAAAKLGEALGDRRILLVIDDAWREQDLRPFLQGGRNTTRLITTRRDDILPAKSRAPASGRHGGERGVVASVFGLAEGSGGGANASACGAGAAAWRMGAAFEARQRLPARPCREKSTSRLPQAIAGVNKRLDLKGFTAFDARSAAASNAMRKTIGVSLELAGRRRARALRRTRRVPGRRGRAAWRRSPGFGARRAASMRSTPKIFCSG